MPLYREIAESLWLAVPVYLPSGGEPSMNRVTTRLLSTTEVACKLGISVRTVCLWAECSELPGFKVGRQWRFRMDAIDGWLGHLQTTHNTPRLFNHLHSNAAITAATASTSSRTVVSSSSEEAI
jgi:excisionase family DNA binding protein